MAGQIINRGENTWQVKVYLGVISGSRKYLAKTVHGRKKDAQALLNKLLLDKDMGQLVAPTRMTLAEYITRWLSTIAKTRVTARTHQGYQAALERYILPELGGKRLSSITPWDIQRVYGAMIERGLSPSTIRHAHAILSTALKSAVRKGDLARNPAELVDLPEHSKIKRDGLSHEQVTAFLNAAADSPHKALYHVLFTCGLRPGEAFGLTWPDVDLTTCELTVRQAVTFGPDRKPILGTPKTKQARRVAFTHELARVLSEHMDRTRDIANPLQLVFPSIDGRLQHPNHWSKRDFKNLLERVGIPTETRLYDTRHAMATIMLQAGVPVPVVSARLGHASPKMTLDVYAHVIPGAQESAAEKLAELLHRQPKPQGKKAEVN